MQALNFFLILSKLSFSPVSEKNAENSILVIINWIKPTVIEANMHWNVFSKDTYNSLV